MNQPLKNLLKIQKKANKILFKLIKKKNKP